MKCTIIKMKISGALERNGAIDMETQEHLKSCDSCRQFAANGASVAGKMNRINGNMEKVSSQMHQRIMAAVYREDETRAQNVVSLPAFMLKTILPIAAAASVALALMVFAWGQAGGGAKSGKAVASAKPEMPNYITSYDHAFSAVNAGISSSVGSSYGKEMDNMKSDIAAAGSFFSGCMSYSQVLQ